MKIGAHQLIAPTAKITAVCPTVVRWKVRLKTVLLITIIIKIGKTIFYKKKKLVVQIFFSKISKNRKEISDGDRKLIVSSFLHHLQKKTTYTCAKYRKSSLMLLSVSIRACSAPPRIGSWRTKMIINRQKIPRIGVNLETFQ